jgi:cytochrome P450
MEVGMSQTVKRSTEAPLASGLPVLGNLLGLAQDTRGFLSAQYLEYGPVFRVRALNREYTVLAGPEANLFLNREGRTCFRSWEFWHDMDKEMGASRSMISLDGPDHSRFRKVQQPGFSRSVVQNHIPEVIAMTQGEIARWPIGQPMDGLYAMQRIVTDHLGTLAAGMSPGEYLDDLIIYIRAVLVTHVTRTRPAILLRTPRVRRAKARVMELRQRVLDSHRGRDPGEQGDLIDDLLALSAVDPAFLPEQDLGVGALSPFIAGLDTVASTCAFMLYALFKHPDLLSRVTEEADAFFAAGDFSAQALRRLDLTHRTAQETLRMYPIAPALTRTVAEPFEFAGYRFTPGTAVIIGTTVGHYLPQYFPNPDTFDVDRFLPERKEHRQPGVFAPFGGGPHTCLGAGFAETEIVLSIATLLHTATLAMDPPGYTLKIDPSPTPSPNRAFRFQMVALRNAPVGSVHDATPAQEGRPHGQ